MCVHTRPSFYLTNRRDIIIPNQNHIIKIKLKLSTTRARETAQWFRALAALEEDPGSIPTTHIVSNCNSGSRGSEVLLWLPLVTHMWHTYIHANQHLYT